MITAPRILVCVILIFAGLYAYGLFSIKAVEARFPPLGTFVTVDGIRLHVLDRGQGPTVVLIHGANGNLRDFAASPLIDALVPTHRVLAFDRPGHGWSERPAGDWVDPDRQAALIHGAVQSMGGGKAVVVGHSLGGAIAMSYGLKFPDDTVGVLDLAGATHPWSGRTSWYNNLARIPVLREIFVGLFKVPAGQLMFDPAITATFRPNPAAPNYRAEGGVDLLLRNGNFLNNAQDVLHLSAFNAGRMADYAQFKPKLMIVTGAEDRSVSPAVHARRMKDAVPTAELIELPGVGHLPQEEAPAASLPALIAFLQQ